MHVVTYKQTNPVEFVRGRFNLAFDSMGFGLYADIMNPDGPNVHVDIHPVRYGATGEESPHESVFIKSEFVPIYLKVVQHMWGKRSNLSDKNMDELAEMIVSYNEFRRVLEGGTVPMDLFNDGEPLEDAMSGCLRLAEKIDIRLEVEIAIHLSLWDYGDTVDVTFIICDSTKTNEDGSRDYSRTSSKYEVDKNNIMSFIQDWRELHQPMLTGWIKHKEESNKALAEVANDEFLTAQNMIESKGFAQLKG